jgi:hypothetical protein
VYPDWLNHVDEKRQRNLIEILQYLSRLQDQKDLDFIIIGALPLLVRGYLAYTVYWDIDLLFKDDNGIREFMQKPKKKTLRIVEYDDALMVSRNITSFHTAWAFNRIWFNVDYIVRKGFFEFYTQNIDKSMLYTDSVLLDNTSFEIGLYMAHPWDIITEKVVSPRTSRDVELRIDTSVDIRHIFAVYKQEKNNMEFWQYIFEKTKSLCCEGDFKKTFLGILSAATELGYGDVEISPDLLKMLKG